jgi:hydroxyquinol 1,2-dioxygenase
MADLDQNTVTEAVIAQMASTPDPRLRDIMASLVSHLHDFAREVKLTPEEWLGAIGFLTRVGQTCTPTGRSSSCCRTLWAFPAWSI